MRFTSLMLLAVITFTSSCRKENEQHGYSSAVTIVELSYITLEGRVTDENNSPVSQVRVMAESDTTVTDVNGYYKVHARGPRGRVPVTFEKPGYFRCLRTCPTKTYDGTYSVNVKLISKRESGSFQSAAGGQINIPAGGSITIPADALVIAGTDTVYTGKVSVFAFFMDSTAADMRLMMPGDLIGVNISNQPRALRTYGMMVLEVEGEAGQKLQLARERSATIKFPIPASMLSQAPVAISLCYFYEPTGLWQEYVSAARQGNDYVSTFRTLKRWLNVAELF